MADEGEEPEAEDGEDEEEGGKKKGGLKKKLLFIGLPIVLVLLLGTAGALMFLGGDKAEDAEHASAEDGGDGHGEAAAAEHGPDPVYYELPAMYANILNDDDEISVLQLIVMLEVDSEATVHLIEPLLPRIVDRYQGFLRELRMDDVKGSAGYYRLKLELLRRVNLAVAPVVVNDLTIDTLLVN